MKPEEQQIAIAKACGWTIQDNEWVGPENHDYHGFRDEDGCWHNVPPDYLNDINAMHEAEKILTPLQRIGSEGYMHHLWDVCAGADGGSTWDVAVSSASQRAEAFLRTLGLYKT